jgi:opacity protein-like surface antigen
MRKALGIVALFIISALPALAQDTPVFEAGVGYQYRSFNYPGEQRLNMDGWQASADGNINHWLGVTADFDGTYKTFGGAAFSVYSYMAGPQVYPLRHHVLTPYFNVLVGGAHIGARKCGGCNLGDTQFSWGGGGGVDLTVSRHFAIRLGQFEYERTGLFSAGTANNPYQNNFKVGAGLLIRLGEK